MDDNLLPSADELSKLNQVSSEIIPWILKRTEIEQDARVEFNKARVELARKDLKSTHKYNFTALIFAFIVIISGMGFSFFLILQQMPTQGTIFAGATIALAAVSFIKASNNKSKK